MRRVGALSALILTCIPSQFGQALREAERQISQRNKSTTGITVSQPKVYDNALLQQMLNAAQARLMSLQLIDQAGLSSRLGAVSGARLDFSALGVNVQGAPMAGVATTSKGPTSSTVTSEGSATAPENKTKSSQTTAGLASQDVVTTAPPFAPPAFNGMAPSVALPASTAFGVNASTVLNEQMQLTYEIANLRLLLEGAISDQVLQTSAEDGSRTITKSRVTVGFPIALDPARSFKNAIAVVEVELGVASGSSLKQGELPSITALLPREQTYNVAAITDRSTSLGGGVATQLIGVSGSWIRGRKSYYLVKDQDTIAVTYRPESRDRIGFQWQFRPVLGQEYVQSGLKQAFVQLSFPSPGVGAMGDVTVRTYWRGFDRSKGIAKDVVAGSLRIVSADDWHISAYPIRPALKLSVTDIEDLGNGSILVNLPGSFAGGTYVRIGNRLLQEGASLIQRLKQLQFIATADELATQKVMLGSRDGTEIDIVFGDGGRIEAALKNPLRIAGCVVKPEDESNTRLTVTLADDILPLHQRIGNTTPAPLLLVAGGRAFGHGSAPIDIDLQKRSLSAVLPTAFLAANPEILVRPLFMDDRYWNGARCTIAAQLPAAAQQGERIVLMEQTKDSARFLLLGTRLQSAAPLLPEGLAFEKLADPAGSGSFQIFRLTLEQAKAAKQIALRKAPGERPVFVNLPAIEVKDPVAPKPQFKPAARITIRADEAVIAGEGLSEVEKVMYNGAPLLFKLAEDGKSLTVRGLRNAGFTSEAKTRDLELVMKPGPVKVPFEIVDGKVETKNP